MPTLFQNGHEVRPYKGQFYYNLRGYDQMHAFPSGLQDRRRRLARDDPQPLDVVWWQCGGGPGVKTPKTAAAPARCPVVHSSTPAPGPGVPHVPAHPDAFHRDVQTHLELHVNFPDCWDGKRLDSPDHHSHMAYSTDYVCPRHTPSRCRRSG